MMLNNNCLAAHNNTVDSELDVFDLQRFAEEDVAADNAEGAGEGVQPEQAPTQQEESKPQTLLGGKTEQEAPTGPPEKYEFTLPQGAEVDEARYNEFAELAKKAGLSNEAANEIANYGFSFAQTTQQAILKQQHQEVVAWGEEAKKELGVDFQQVVATAGTGLEVLEKTIPGIREALNETGAGNRVEIIRAMAYLGELVKEDGGLGLAGGKEAANKTMYPNTNFEKY